MSLTSKPTPEKAKQIRKKPEHLAELRHSNQMFDRHKAAYDARQKTDNWGFKMKVMVFACCGLVAIGVFALIIGASQ